MAKMYEWKSNEVGSPASLDERKQYSREMKAVAQSFLGSSNFRERRWEGASSGLAFSLKHMPHVSAVRWATSIAHPEN